MPATSDLALLQALADRAQALDREVVGLGREGRLDQAATAAANAVAAWRELHAALAAPPVAAHLASSLYNLGVALRRLARREQALAATAESARLFREATRTNPQAFASDLARSLDNLGAMLLDVGRHEEALSATEEAVQLYRGLAHANPNAVARDLLISLYNLGLMLGDRGRVEEALAADEEAVRLCRELTRKHPQTSAANLAAWLTRLGARLDVLGRRNEAVASTAEAADLYRTLASNDPQAFAPVLARTLTNLGIRLGEAGRHPDALQAAEKALELYRELATRDREAFLPDLADGLDMLGVAQAKLGNLAEAVDASGQAIRLWREEYSRNAERAEPGLARALANLANRLQAVGRYAEASDAADQAMAHLRKLADTDRPATLPALAMCLANIAAHASRTPESVEARSMAAEAVALYQELVSSRGEFYAPGLALSLHSFGLCLAAQDEPLEAARQLELAVGLYRKLLKSDGLAYKPDLAMALSNLAEILRRTDRNTNALAAAEEAVELRRDELGTAFPRSAELRLAQSLSIKAGVAAQLGLGGHSLAALRECGSLVLGMQVFDPHSWVDIAWTPLMNLCSAEDLREFHLPLLRQLTELRELAWNTDHARVYLDLQAEIAARVWVILATLPSSLAELHDEALAALIAAMQSPDLARWLEARGSGDGALAKLAELKRGVIEAEQLLAALRKGLGGDDGTGLRTGPAVASAEAQRAMADDIERQATKAQSLRQAFRDERARLAAEDPRFAAAFEPLGPQALRSLARHGDGGAVLCVLQLQGTRSDGHAEPSSPAQHRSVAALLYADGRRTQLLELSGLSELAWHAQCYAPERIDRGRGPLRGAPAGAPGSAPTDAVPPAMADLLASRMSGTFWAPLQQALQESVAVDRLHVCLHGTTQQLPLALRQDSDCPGLQVVPWPGLPYLRLAESAAAATATPPARAPAVPWLIGHDCAWASAQPLPMVAVEAALLRHLLQQHGQPVQAIAQAAQLSGDAAALVACCHGGAEQAQFDHALHLGGQPLTVRQILNDRLGPHLALLPACYAGRTDEDAAGNALGVAAAFMLSGTKVVVASSKAVPDVLQPWLSTLMVWHAMQGRPHHEAMTRAREQFAKLEFPEGYRSWLQQALPQALATIQPRGEEDEHIRGVRAQTALEQVEQRWPWEGETNDLFSADAVRREEATRSVVQGILVPRGGEDGARALAAEARAMAAFVFVYGVDSTSG